MSEVNGFNSITSNTSLVLATGQDDHRDTSDARMLTENKNLGSQQMPTRVKNKTYAPKPFTGTLEMEKAGSCGVIYFVVGIKEV